MTKEEALRQYEECNSLNDYINLAEKVKSINGLNDKMWTYRIYEKAFFSCKTLSDFRYLGRKQGYLIEKLSSENSLDREMWRYKIYISASKCCKTFYDFKSLTMDVKDDEFLLEEIFKESLNKHISLEDCRWLAISNQISNKVLIENVFKRAFECCNTFNDYISILEDSHEEIWKNAIYKIYLENCKKSTNNDDYEKYLINKWHLNDKMWMIVIFQEVYKLCKKADDYKHLALKVEQYLDDKNWAQEIRQNIKKDTISYLWQLFNTLLAKNRHKAFA